MFLHFADLTSCWKNPVRHVHTIFHELDESVVGILIPLTRQAICMEYLALSTVMNV